MKLTSEATATRADSSRKKFRRRDPLPDLSRFLTAEQHGIHLVGVAGSGMSGLAGLLIELGHSVSGSDKVTTTETERLERLGLRFHEQHLAELADAADLVVFSSAIKDDNPSTNCAQLRKTAVPTRGSRRCNHANQARHCDRRNAWQNDHLCNDGTCAS